MNGEFSKRLAAARKKNGISQKQAALDLGVSQALLSHYERGIRECGLDFVARVSEYYGVSADYLLGLKSDSGSSAQSDRYMVRALRTMLDYVDKTSNSQFERFSQTFIELSLYRIITVIMEAYPDGAVSHPYADMRSDRMADGYMQLCIAKLMKLAQNDSIGAAGRTPVSSIKNSAGWDSVQKVISSSEKLINELSFDKKTTE